MADFQEDLYVPKERMYLAIDCVIFGFDSGTIKLLIFKPRVEPLLGKWSLIGSFLRLNEDVEEAARRVLREITGLENVFMEELKTYGKADRDPGFRCVSIGMYALIRINDHDQELVEKLGAHWHGINEVPELVLDHKKMVQDALGRIRRKSRYKPIGFELLPEKFTFRELRQLYEAIYQKELDDRNFRKKMLSLNVLTKLNERDKFSSRRKAYLYKFDYTRYQELLKSGYNFKIFLNLQELEIHLRLPVSLF